MRGIFTTHLVSEEAARDIDLLATDHHNLLAGENLLGDDGRQPTQKVPLAIDDNGGGGEGRHLEGLRSMPFSLEFRNSRYTLRKSNTNLGVKRVISDESNDGRLYSHLED